MEIIILILVMVVVGLVIGWLAGPIWKNNRPFGASGDYIASIITTVVVGLIDWFVIPAMGFSDRLRNMGVALEPALGALIVLWIIRRAKK
jgi:uncharacterized membrane protein YeaQ/YmgE (transglycosylase-associated protein family)